MGFSIPTWLQRGWTVAGIHSYRCDEEHPSSPFVSTVPLPSPTHPYIFYLPYLFPTRPYIYPTLHSSCSYSTRLLLYTSCFVPNDRSIPTLTRVVISFLIFSLASAKLRTHRPANSCLVSVVAGVDGIFFGFIQIVVVGWVRSLWSLGPLCGCVISSSHLPHNYQNHPSRFMFPELMYHF